MQILKLYPQNYIVLHEIFAVFLTSNKKEGYRLWYPFLINLIQQGVLIRH